MRLTTLIMIVAILQVSANSLAQKITLSQKNTSLEVVFEKIGAQTGYDFLFTHSTLKGIGSISIEVENVELSKVLEKIFADQPLEYSLVGKSIVVFPENVSRQGRFKKEDKVLQQQVMGIVSDTAGAPLPGVSVQVKGSEIGALTDINGQYELSSIDEKAVLVFSLLGHLTQEVPVSGKSEINMILKEDLQALDEVVVVGYGTQKAGEITSSISHLSEKDFSKGATSNSPLQLLSGRVAGLALSRAGGGDPTAGIEVQLRGVSSIRGSTAPLVVIDGVPGGSLNSIAPESIESMSVLRDGSAAAIYGTRANAGVIIITTKRGETGSPAVSYSTYLYTERYANKPNYLSAGQYRDLKNEWTGSDDPFWRSIAGSMVDYGHETDWFDVITQNRFSQVHNIAVSGGSSSTRYYGSLNYRDENGLIRNTGQNVLNGRLSLTQYALDSKLQVNLDINNSFINSRPFDGEIMAQPFFRNPTMPVYNTDESLKDYLYNPDGKYFEINGYMTANPLGLIEQFDRENRSTVFLGTGKISYEIINGLEVSLMSAYQRTSGLDNYYESKDSWASWNQTNASGVAQKSTYLEEVKTFEPTVTYNVDISNSHNINALIGYSYQESITENFSAANRTFLSDDFGTHNLGAGLQIASGSFSDPVSSDKISNKLIAGFARVNYAYNGKYMFSASIRREGSTKFGANNKWGNFPAVSAGWRISDESFMDNIDFIDNLKLRAGYGITGNQGIPDYLSLSRLSPSGFMLYQGEWIPGYIPSSNPNPDLKWEKKSEVNLGIEATIFDDISFTIDFYDRTTRDLLFEYRVPVPPNTYERTWANVGSINNRGVEFTINATPIEKPSFSWNTNFNISYNENELVSLSNDVYERSFLFVDMPSAGRFGMSGEVIYRVDEGEPIGNIYTYEHAGINEAGEWLVLNKDDEKIPAGEASFDDKKVTGNGLPKSWLGFNNTFQYKQFDLQLSLRGALGFELLNTIHLHSAYPKRLPANMPDRVLEEPDLLRLRDQRNYLDSYWVESGDYLKVDNITLGYSWSLNKIKQLRVYVSGQNLHTFTKYKGQDPEHAIEGLSPGYDQYWQYPRIKSFTLGVNVNF